LGTRIHWTCVCPSQQSTASKLCRRRHECHLSACISYTYEINSQERWKSTKLRFERVEIRLWNFGSFIFYWQVVLLLYTLLLYYMRKLCWSSLFVLFVCVCWWREMCIQPPDVMNWLERVRWVSLHPPPSPSAGLGGWGGWRDPREREGKRATSEGSVSEFYLLAMATYTNKRSILYLTTKFLSCFKNQQLFFIYFTVKANLLIHFFIYLYKCTLYAAITGMMMDDAYPIYLSIYSIPIIYIWKNWGSSYYYYIIIILITVLSLFFHMNEQKKKYWLQCNAYKTHPSEYKMWLDVCL